VTAGSTLATGEALPQSRQPDVRRGDCSGGVERLTTEYVNWHDHARVPSELGYVTPEEYEQAHYAAPPDPPLGES